MKANAPETYLIQFRDKIDEYLWKEHHILGGCCSFIESLKYTVAREVAEKLTDAFIEKALKWYCLDCECNDNCKDTKCFFHNAYKRYLEGDTKSLPPKFSNTILNEDGSTSDNWRYRHFTSKMQDTFIEKAAEWLSEIENGTTITDIDKFVEDFKNYMKG